MIDPGIDLEPERREIVTRMHGTPPEQWRAEDLRVIRDNADPQAEGIPTKHIYGSDFPYRGAEHHVGLERLDVGAGPSLARGGFSNVWGAVVAPYHEDDIADWPSPTRELGQHYDAVLRLMHLSAEEDELAAQFPLHTRAHSPLRGSRQAEAFLKDCRASRHALAKAGIHIGRSRLAVRADPSGADPGCAYCGLCLYGCPYGLIYNSQSTLRVLERDSNFHYRTDVVVTRLNEKAQSVTIRGHSRTDDVPVELTAERVYLACGVFSTTRILLESLEAYDVPVTIRDSQYFLLPLLRYRGTRGVQSEALHTLAQAFMEIRDPEITPRTIHMEVFTYNDMMPAAAASRLGLLAPLLEIPVSEFLRRVIVNQCFLHSDLSATISACLTRGEAGEKARLLLEGRPNAEVRKVVAQVWRKLLAHRGQLRAVPVPPLIEIASPGRSYHSGGSFPMRTTPGPFECDVWGRPHGLQRVHAVDATTFPTLPATTITLPVMANAHRIGAGFGAT